MASLPLLSQWDMRRNLAYVLYDDCKSHTNTLKNYVLVFNGWPKKVAEKAILFHRVFWLGPNKENMQIGLPSNFTLQCPQHCRELHLSLKCEQKNNSSQVSAGEVLRGFYDFNITIFVLNVNFHWFYFLLNLNTFETCVFYGVPNGSFLRNRNTSVHLS